MIRLYWKPTWDGWTWWNVSAPAIQTRGGLFLLLWEAFNRVGVDGHWWGFGLVNVNGRYLLYIGSRGVQVAFVRVRWDA